MDGIEEWSRAQQRVIDLVSGLSEAQAAAPVPACPAWSVRDLLSHMVGLGADVVAGDEPDDHNGAWTARQVERRRDRDIPALVAEWQRVASPLRDWMRERGIRPLNDVIIHEQDLRGAAGVPGAQDTPALAAVRDRYAGRFRDAVAGLPPIALVGDHWRLDAGGAAGGGGGEPAVLVRAPDFDLARALTTRRSEAQLRSWASGADLTPYLPGFALLGPLPANDLSES